MKLKDKFDACWRAIHEGDPSGFAALIDLALEHGVTRTGRPIPTIADRTRWDEAVLTQGVSGRAVHPGRVIWSAYTGQSEYPMEWADVAIDQWREKSLFERSYWDVKAQQAGDPSSVRIDGVHYWVGVEEESRFGRGFGGRRFRIRFFDGREVVTSNLWHQGEIPAHLRPRLPDNAEFVREG